MHSWKKEHKKLRGLLGEFMNGQFSMVSNYGEIIRGELESTEVNFIGKTRSVDVRLRWMFVKTKDSDGSNIPGQIWSRRLESGVCIIPPIHLTYFGYYFQESKNRVKLRTSLREDCWFFMPNDPSNIIMDDEFRVTPGRVEGPEMIEDKDRGWVKRISRKIKI